MTYVGGNTFQSIKIINCQTIGISNKKNILYSSGKGTWNLDKNLLIGFLKGYSRFVKFHTITIIIRINNILLNIDKVFIIWYII